MSRSRRHRRQALRDMIMAAVLVLLLIATAGFVFRSGEMQRSAVEEGVAADVARVALPMDKRELPAKLHPLIDYLTVMDPTIMTQPADTNPLLRRHDVDLYSRRSEFRRERRPLEILPADLGPEIPYLPAVTPVGLTFTDFWAAVDQRQAAAPGAAPTADQPKPVAAGVYWVDADGKAVGGLPLLSIGAIQKALKPDELSAREPTVLQVAPGVVKRAEALEPPPAGSQPRVRLVRSSGNPKLDDLAARHLRAFLARIAASPPGVQRRNWIESTRYLTVHWEHVPGLKYRPEFPTTVREGELEEVPWYDLNQH